MNSKTSNETTTPINLGNPNEITMLELAEKIINITNSKSKLVFSELPKDDPFQRKPDINKALNVLEWAPLVNLDEGLKKTINYFKTINHFKTIN